MPTVLARRLNPAKINPRRRRRKGRRNPSAKKIAVDTLALGAGGLIGMFVGGQASKLVAPEHAFFAVMGGALAGATAAHFMVG